MTLFLAMAVMLALYGARIKAGGQFNTKYLNKEHTGAVNGIFVILVLFSHYAQYADFGGVYDNPYLMLRAHLGQAVVATFMFYSGYGMTESVKKRGKSYVDKIPSKLLKLLLKFDAAVLLYLVMNLLLGISYERGQIILAFTTWTAIGNSNWYITAILMLYVAMYIAFSIGFSAASERMARAIGIAATFTLTAAVVIIQMKAGRPAYCYNTMALFPLGCLYSEHREEIEKKVAGNKLSYIVVLAATVGVYVFSYFRRTSWGLFGYTIWVAAFMALILLITMKVSIYNRVLEWIGKHVFSIYILQRLPMTVLDHFGIIEAHKYLSLLVVIAVTLPMALLFETLTDAIINATAALKLQR